MTSRKGPRKGMSDSNRKMAQVQYKIRQNASEMQDYLKGLGKWEQDQKRKEKALKTTIKKTKTKTFKPAVVPKVRATKGSTVYAASTSQSNQAAAAHPMLSKHLKTSKSSKTSKEPQYRSPAEAARAKKAAAASDTTKDSHTYDKGYKKWENYNVEDELAKVDSDSKTINSTNVDVAATTTTKPVRGRTETGQRKKSAPSISREELYKQDGNKHYQRGEFQQSIKCYTRCIASNPKNAVAYSNRKYSKRRSEQCSCNYR